MDFSLRLSILCSFFPTLTSILGEFQCEKIRIVTGLNRQAERFDAPLAKSLVITLLADFRKKKKVFAASSLLLSLFVSTMKFPKDGFHFLIPLVKE